MTRTLPTGIFFTDFFARARNEDSLQEMSDRMPIDTVRMYVFTQFPFITILLYVLGIIINRLIKWNQRMREISNKDFSEESNLEILIKYDTVGFKNK